MPLPSAAGEANGRAVATEPSTPLSRQNSNAIHGGYPPPSPPPESPEPPTSVPAPGDGLRHHRSHRIRSFGPHEDDAGDAPGHARIRTYTDDQRTKLFPRIAKPVEMMRSSYDVLVIGSGYGGAVAASRMARAKSRKDGKRRSVCVLERGQEKWPGEYPAGMLDSFKQLHVSGEFAPGFLPGTLVDGGDPTGMYHLIFGKGLNAVVCNGLGGTSLMNANVFLRADAGTLNMPMWPQEIQDDPTSLDEYYSRVEKVLEPTPYPDDWPRLPKVELLHMQAKLLDKADKFRMVPQTTRFRNGPNSVGVEMLPSAMTGQDCTGVNDGSKTTTLVTYLADAWNWGAEMFCECEVRYIRKAEGREGYIVYFAWHGRNRGHFRDALHEDLMWVHAKECVFLGAGAIGTTEILLRSKEMGLDMSDRVGQNMSGNGDMLAFGYNTDYEANAIGKPIPNPYNPIGPTINSIIDCREGVANPLDGYVIEEGAIPKALAPLMQTMLELMPGSRDPVGESLTKRLQARLARYGSWLLGPYLQNGAMDNTQVYLVMSHDSSQAVLTLKDDKPVLEFIGVGASDKVKELNDILAEATQRVGGTFVQNPFYALMGKQQVTVHPIGGACMSPNNDGTSGVTNHRGQVFSGDDDEVHDGLIVMDGALIPGALGVNPFATIAALAERNVQYYANDAQLDIDWKENRDKHGNRILDLFGEPQNAPKEADLLPGDKDDVKEGQDIRNTSAIITGAAEINAAGFGFTEVMAGFIHKGEGMLADKQETYELAYRTAKGLCESARFFLSVQAYNTRTLIHDDDHEAVLSGTFVCPTIPGSPFMVRGTFNLFVLDHRTPGTRNLTYDFDMEGVDGKKLHFHGYKVLDSSVALAPYKLWKASSTLYCTITDPSRSEDEDEDDLEDSLDGTPSGSGGAGRAKRRPKIIAKGIMNIKPMDFMSELLTMTPTGSSLLRKAWSTFSFLKYFTKSSLSLFLAPFTSLQYPSVTYTGYTNDTKPDASFIIVDDPTAERPVKTRMHMWEPTNPRIETKNLFMVPGASVDHQIYALPTIPYNAVNYFTRAGYRVFVCVHRIGQLMVAQGHWTTYDARLDIRGCLEYIRTHYPGQNGPGNKVYTIAHCMGSVALSSGMLDGTIPTEWIQGLTCSQVFMNPVWGTLNMAKVMAGPIPLDTLYTMLAGSWFSCSTSRDDTIVQQGINQLLRFYPQERREICNNASCHRTSFVFGRCWNHRNLNEATHRQIDRFFGGVNMTLLHLLMRQGFEGHVMNNKFEKLTTPDNIERLRGIPIMLFVGRDNAVLSVESTGRTYEKLCETFGSRDENGGILYRRKIVPGYGHLDGWMGRNAWKDVYPFVREEVDRVVRGEDYHFDEPDDKYRQMIESGELLY